MKNLIKIHCIEKLGKTGMNHYPDKSHKNFSLFLLRKQVLSHFNLFQIQKMKQKMKIKVLQNKMNC